MIRIRKNPISYKKLTVALSMALVICIVFILSILYGKDEFLKPEAVITIPAAASTSPSSFMLTADEFITAMTSNVGLGHQLYTYGEKTVSDGVVKIGIASETALDSGDMLTVIGNLTLKTDDSGLVSSAGIALTFVSNSPDAIPVSKIINANVALAQAFLLAADSKMQMLSASEYNEILSTITQYDTYTSHA